MNYGCVAFLFFVSFGISCFLYFIPSSRKTSLSKFQLEIVYILAIQEIFSIGLYKTSDKNVFLGTDG